MDQQSTFPVPFSLEQLRQDVVEIYGRHLWAATLFSSAEDQAITTPNGKAMPEAGHLLWSPDEDAAAIGLRYEDIAGSPLVKALEQEYDYAFHGVSQLGVEAMEYESIHTWVAAYLMDLSVSRVVLEWESYGGELSSSIERCLHACELANARRVLEGFEPFSHFSSARADDKEDRVAIDALTIRQVALLGAMEEMSIRQAASRKQLKTHKAEDSRTTLVSLEEAKLWLKAKGKYLEITKRWAGGELDLRKTKFASWDEFFNAIDAHARRLETQGNVGIRQLALQAASAAGWNTPLILQPDYVDEPALLQAIAAALQLPPDLFLLRAKQAQLGSEMRILEQSLRSTIELGSAAA